MKIPFTYLMHKDEELDEIVDSIICNALLEQFSEEEIETIYYKIRDQGNPFHTVVLNCELDTDTGKVMLLDASL